MKKGATATAKNAKKNVDSEKENILKPSRK